MPAVEQVLNKPLSGEEVRRIIVSKLEQTLADDTRLAAYLAFPSFTFRLDVAIILTGSVAGNVERTIESGVGRVDEDPNQPATVLTHHVEQPLLPANEARVDAGLGVPVLTRDERGREIERTVKYTKEQKNRAKGQ
jgi:hypothetical protein